MANTEKKKTVFAGDVRDPDSFKNFPKEPSTWDSIKETFEPTATRIMLEQVRKRRQSKAE